MKRRNREALAALAALKQQLDSGATLTLRAEPRRTVTLRGGNRYIVTTAQVGYGGSDLEATMHSDFASALLDWVGKVQP
jgi:hypothetical protein